MTRALLVSVGVVLSLGGCGSSSSSANLPDGYYITISNMAYSPLDLRVPPGATVTVINNDPMQHTVTSEATAGEFQFDNVNGISFDTGAFSGQASFTIPTDALDGTVVPYFCNLHKATMATPNGTITIDASAVPGPPPG